MRTLRTLVIIIVCGAALALATATAAAKDKWINLTTKNFFLVSNAGEDDTREVALKLEQFHYVFSKLFNIRAATSKPMTVMVFKSDGSFKPFKPLYNGKPANLAGYFQKGTDENLIALNINGNELRPMALIFHEYVHLLTSLTPRAWPPWLNEGLAEVYSSFDVKKKEVTLGAPIGHHVHLLRERKLMPLPALFGVTRGSPAYNERDKQGIFYAQSWALTHYLMFGNNGARRPQLTEFVKLINGGHSADRAFAQVFKDDTAALEKELRGYLNKDSYPVVIYTLDSVEGEKEMSVRPLGDAEVQFYLGNLLMRTNRLDEAEGYFKQALALDPNLAQAREGMGFLAMRRDRRDEALKYFKEAAGRDSKNHLTHYYYAMALHEEAHGNLTPEAVEKITQALATTVKLNPGFAPAHHQLGNIALMTGRNLKEGAAAMRTAIRLEPQNPYYALTLAQIQMRMEDYAGAKKTLEPLAAEDSGSVLKAEAQAFMRMIEDYSRPVTPPQETSGPSPPAAEGPPATYEPGGREIRITGRPTMRFPGTEITKGELVAIECPGDNTMVLVVRTAEKLARFLVSDPIKLEFYSQDPTFEGQIGCGPVKRLAFIYFKPVPEGKSQFAGDVIAVEFTK